MIGPRGSFPHAHRPWLHPEGFLRTDLGNVEWPGADYEVMRTHLLDSYGLDFAVLTGEEAIDGQHTLLYASDYPHWDYDDPNQLQIPPEWRKDVFDANARRVYRRLPSRPENAPGNG